MPIETHHELTIPYSMAIEPKMCWTLYSSMIYIRHKLWEKNWPKMYNFAFFPIFVQKWAFPLYLGDYRLVWFRLIPIFMPAMYSPGKVGAHDAHNTLHRNFPPRHSCHSSRGRHESRSRGSAGVRHSPAAFILQNPRHATSFIISSFRMTFALSIWCNQYLKLYLTA